MSSDPEQAEGQPPDEQNPAEPLAQETPIENPDERPVQERPLENSDEPPVPETPFQSPYWQQPVQGMPSYAYEQPSGYGYVPPLPSPLPLAQAIRGLFNQYLKILTRPGAKSFWEEQGKAEWAIIWIQLLLVGLAGTLMGLLKATLFSGFVWDGFQDNVTSLGTTVNSLPFLIESSGFSVFSLFYSIITFFAVVGLQYLLAKAFGGTGSFKQQGYNYLLFYVPLTLLSTILGLIPCLGTLGSIAFWIYQLVLNVFSVMASQRLNGGKAAAVVLIPLGAVIILGMLSVGIVALALTYLVFR